MAKDNTWTVGMWLNNDAGLYSEVVSLAEDSADIEELAGKLETLITETYLPELEGLYAELLQDALDQIDWVELAQDFEDWIPVDEPEELEDN